MRPACLAVIALALAHPLAAQEAHVPVIPNIIAPDTQGARISVTVDRGLTSNKQLRSAALRAARTALHDGGEVSAADMRALAERGDGLAAQRYVRVLVANRAAPSDIAYFAAIAVGSGRIWTLKQMIEAMHLLDPETEPRARIRTYIRVLYPHAWAGNALALEAVVDFNGEDRLFGPLSDRTRDRILAEARATGDGRIELGMAMGLLERTRATSTPRAADLEEARSLLLLAQASDHLAVTTAATNLLRLMDKASPDDS